MHGEVSAKIREIKEDTTHGASWLARQALRAVMLAAQTSEARTIAQLLDELKAVARELMETRPSMASITNAVCRLVYDVAQESEQEVDLDSLKLFIQSKGMEIIQASEEAVVMIAKYLSEMISTGDRLFTCSYSSTVCHAVKVARENGKDFFLLIAESRSKHGASFGMMAAEEVREYGLQADIVPDEAIRRHIARANKVLVGADSVLSDGSLINGTPSYELAVAAQENGVPFYALCEKSKFDVRSYFDQEPGLEEGFDHIPARLITGILTEDGMVRPQDVTQSIEGMRKYREILAPNEPWSNNL